MFGIDGNHATLTAWMNVGKVMRENLYMRANLYNEQELIAHASNTFTAMRKDALVAGSVELIAPDKIAKNVKSFVDLIKKCDSAWDEWLRDEVVLEEHAASNASVTDPARPKLAARKAKITSERGRLQYRARMAKLSKFQDSVEGVHLARIGEWSRSVSSKGGRLDKGIVAVVGTLMYGKLGRLTESISMEKFFLKLSKEKVASVTAPTERAVADGKMTRVQGDEHLKNYVASGQAESAARREGATRARTAAQAESVKVKGSLQELLHDERTKLRDQIALSSDDWQRANAPRRTTSAGCGWGC